MTTDAKRLIQSCQNLQEDSKKIASVLRHKQPASSRASMDVNLIDTVSKAHKDDPNFLLRQRHALLVLKRPYVLSI